MTTLFISDLHLSEERPDISRAFFSLLAQRARGIEALYILGDLFEAWIGDDDPSPLAREVIAALAACSASGTALWVQHGNRDFLLGQRFARETGAGLLPDEAIIDLHGERVLLMHGDTLCSDDHDYQRFRRRVRNPLVKWLLRSLPLKRRQAIARRWRDSSRQHKSNKPENIMDVNQDTVAATMRRHRVTLLIHGHTHRPARHPLVIDGTAAERIVLGDWDKQPVILVAERDAEPALQVLEAVY